MRKLVLILIVFIAVVTFIRTANIGGGLAAETPGTVSEGRVELPKPDQFQN